MGSGDPSGEANSDNAKSIRNAACSVGNYMSAFLRVRISGPAWVCYNESYINVSAVVQLPTFGNPGVGPYSYEWRWSYTGDFVNDPSYLFGTGSSAQLAVPPPGVDDIWIRLKVTSSDNVVIYEYRDINIFGPDDHHCDNFQGGGAGGNLLIGAPSLTPNPASNEITLSVQSEYEKSTEIVISNLTGNTVFKLGNQYLYKGRNQFQFDVSSLPIGIYTLSILTESNIESVKFIINR